MKKTYSEADIDAAVKLFQTTDNSLSQCVKIHGIPRMTLSDRIKGKHKSTIGAPTKLGLTCEQSLVAILVLLASIRFGLGRFELQPVVNNYLKLSNNTALFKDGQVTDDWYYGFIKRNQEQLQFRRVNTVDSKRAMACNPVTS